MNRMETNVFDNLLQYLSHVGEIRWAKFKEAVNRVTGTQPSFRYATYLQILARLGHLDYNPTNVSGDGVVIAPAVLVETAVAERYVLVGSRTPNLLKALQTCVSEVGGEVQSLDSPYAPTTIVLNGLSDRTLSAVERLDIHVSRAFSARLSNVLPVPKRTCFQKDNTSLLDLQDKFNPRTLKYEPDTSRMRSDGLYKIVQHGAAIYVLKTGADQRCVPRDWGEWQVLSRTPELMAYERETRTWRVKRNLRLPLIVERCATLCSGFPPKRTKRFTSYPDVPAGVAYRLTKSLYQEWEEVSC